MNHTKIFEISAITIETRKRGNCECIATWGHPSHASPSQL